MSNLDVIIKQINKKIENTVKEDVVEIVKKTWSEHVSKDVYAAYKPKKYERRGSNGGLGERNNIVITKFNSNSGKVELEIENITKGRTPISNGYKNNSYKTAKAIEIGRYMWGNVGARRFTANTIKELSNGKLKRTVKEGLSKRGLNVK